MNWINVATIVMIIVGVCILAYLMWFMAHPRSRERAEKEAEEWSRKHRLKDREKAQRSRAERDRPD